MELSEQGGKRGGLFVPTSCSFSRRFLPPEEQNLVPLREVAIQQLPGTRMSFRTLRSVTSFCSLVCKSRGRFFGDMIREMEGTLVSISPAYDLGNMITRLLLEQPQMFSE